MIHTKFRNFLQVQWDADPHPYLHPIKPNLKHWPSINQDNRLKEVILARLRLGHTKITQYFILQKESPTLCQTCNRRYSIKHFLLHCPLYDSERQPLLRHASANRLPLTLPNLLGDSYPDMIVLLFEFLHSTRLELFI